MDLVFLFLIYLENYGVLMLHSLFEHWPVTKQVLGIYISTKIYCFHLLFYYRNK